MATPRKQAWWERPVDLDVSWMDEALCAQIGGDLWLPENGGYSSPVAKQVCGVCPVRFECLEYALAQPGIQGVFGGTTDKERNQILLRRRAS